MDADGTLENSADDPIYGFVYDDRWRKAATVRGELNVSGVATMDSTAKEFIVHHHAGVDGLGGSSPLDSIASRWTDADTAWNLADSDTLLE